MSRLGLSLLFTFISLFIIAQGKGKLYKQYQTGKEFIEQKKFDLAQAQFELLTIPSKNNIYEEHAYYFMAHCAYQQNDMMEARQILSTAVEKFPNWENKEEYYYLYADVLFNTQEYTEAVTNLNQIQQADLSPMRNNLEGHYASQLDLATLRFLQKENPQDKMLAQVLVDKIAFASEDWQDLVLMDELILSLDLNRPQNQKLLGKLNTKESYRVAVIFPFNLSGMQSEESYLEGLKNSKTSSINKIAVEMYQGMRLALKDLDSLNQANLELLTFDIQKNDIEKLKNYMNNGEFDNVDLIVGPFYDEQFELIANFAERQKINVVNPISDNPENIYNDFTFLSQPTMSTVAQKTASILKENTEGNKVIIFYDNLANNKSFALKQQEVITATDCEVLEMVQVGAGNVEKIEQILTTHQNEDLAYVLVSSTSQLIAQEVLKVFKEKDLQKTPILTWESWLKFNDIDDALFLEQDVYFIALDHLMGSSEYIRIEKEYNDFARTKPNKYAFIGYDLLTFFGKMLEEYGVRNSFKEFFQNIPPTRGKIIPAFDFQNGNDNQFIPILRYQNGDIKLVYEVKE